MFPTLGQGACCLLPTLVNSLTLNVPQGFTPAGGLIQLNGSSSDVILPPAVLLSQPLNTTPAGNATLDVIKLNTSTVNGPEIHCDDTVYGQPPVDSCADAFAQVPLLFPSPTWSFGPRGEGNFDIGLPYRWIGCNFLPSHQAQKLQECERSS